jgi:hypothetical protein
MKLAISILDPAFRKAEALAKRLNMSRSAIFAKAVEAYDSYIASNSLTDAANRFADELSAEMVEERHLWLQAGAHTVLKHTKW